MTKVRPQPPRQANPPQPPTFVLSRRVMMLANLLKRAATIRYRRLLDLRPGEWGIIGQLGERAPRSLIDLADGMGLDKAQISRGVTSLVKQGLVTRKTNPRNSREVLIALTPRGSAANQTILEAGGRVNEILLADLTPKERRQLGELLNQFTRRAQTLLGEEQALGPVDDDDAANE
jgi:DNA-binding MarR family transcriptional regulator